MYCVKSIVITIVLLLIEYIGCNCGPPGNSIGGQIYGYSSIIAEGNIVRYECRNDLDEYLVYGQSRTCIKGKWNQRIPKCGKNFAFKIIV
jgi:hypothetical protein